VIIRKGCAAKAILAQKGCHFKHMKQNTSPDSSDTQQLAHVSQTWGKLLNKKQAADYIGCSCRYVERAIVMGRLRALKPTGKLVRIRRADLEAFLESGATIGGIPQ
jgi:excisionase family DNA binding protein